MVFKAEVIAEINKLRGGLESIRNRISEILGDNDDNPDDDDSE